MDGRPSTWMLVVWDQDDLDLFSALIATDVDEGVPVLLRIARNVQRLHNPLGGEAVLAR